MGAVWWGETTRGAAFDFNSKQNSVSNPRATRGHNVRSTAGGDVDAVNVLATAIRGVVLRFAFQPGLIVRKTADDRSGIQTLTDDAHASWATKAPRFANLAEGPCGIGTRNFGIHAIGNFGSIKLLNRLTQRIVDRLDIPRI